LVLAGVIGSVNQEARAEGGSPGGEPEKVAAVACALPVAETGTALGVFVAAAGPVWVALPPI
jgi:hypothetical protein